jgi:hypothetical protein
VADVRTTALQSIKQASKQRHPVLEGELRQVIPAVLECVKERGIPTKLAAERALLYLLHLDTSDDYLQAYVQATPAVAKTLGDYHRRVLAKLATTLQQGETSEGEE